MVDFARLGVEAQGAVDFSKKCFQDKLDGKLSIKFNDCSKIYFSSNECLENLFHNFSVEGKDVLCVAGSGDQAFQCLSRGASSVDLFDLNKLSKYYFYLRLWGIKYFDSCYPNLNDLFESHNWIKKMVSNIDCSELSNEEEREAFYFWAFYVTKQDLPLFNRYLFNLSSNPYVNDISDLSGLKKTFDGKNISFIHEDICGDKVDLSKKYDLVIMSNILEYCNGDKLVLKRTRDNLNSILNDNGTVICSRIIHNDQDISSIVESDVFSDMFDKEEFSYEFDPILEKQAAVGYAYKKKC